MKFFGFGRKGLGQPQGVGRKGVGEPPSRPERPLFGKRATLHIRSRFDVLFDQWNEEKRPGETVNFQHFRVSEIVGRWSPEERGELLAELADQPGVFDGHRNGRPDRESVANRAYENCMQSDCEVSAGHLGGLLKLLLGNESFRRKGYVSSNFDKLLKLIGSAIKQGAYLSSSDCEALANMAAELRDGKQSLYRKADTKKLISRAERLEKLAGVEVSATDFLMQRCEGAENPNAIKVSTHPNAQFWADLLAEIILALEEIRCGTKGSKPAWMGNPVAFSNSWPTCGDVAPRFGAWKENALPFTELKHHNGKRTGFADPERYRRLPETIALAQLHSRYNWNSDQIPALDVIGDLENPAWTALVEHLITQRRATRATRSWEKEALALCQPLGVGMVEERLHEWLSLFHTPPLNMTVYTDLRNGERFLTAIERLEQAHADWPVRHADEIPALGRAVAMVVASEPKHGLCSLFRPELIRADDNNYKGNSATDGLVSLPSPDYKTADGRTLYESLATWMRLSVENEEFMRGTVWLVALMPDRGRAIDALEKISKTAATYLWVGEEAMRSRIIANAAIATLIAMGGSDIDRVVLRLSKAIDNRTINAPLFKHLNAEG